MTEEEFEEKFRREWAAYKRERNERLHRFFVMILIVFALGGFTMAATVYYTYTTSQKNQTGLCAMRADAQERIDQSADFLKENPNGIPGISAEQLKRSTANSIRTRDALKDLDCPKAEEGS